MKRILLGITLLLLTFTTFAVTKMGAIIVYKNIIKANHIKNPPTLHFSNSREINAYYDVDSNSITIFTGMLKACNVHKIAWILGHELGHFYKKDVESNWKAEFAADIEGYKLAKKAGYNMKNGQKIINKFSTEPSESHPPNNLRLIKIPE